MTPDLKKKKTPSCSWAATFYNLVNYTVNSSTALWWGKADQRFGTSGMEAKDGCHFRHCFIKFSENRTETFPDWNLFALVSSNPNCCHVITIFTLSFLASLASSLVPWGNEDYALSLCFCKSFSLPFKGIILTFLCEMQDRTGTNFPIVHSSFEFVLLAIYIDAFNLFSRWRQPNVQSANHDASL